MVGCGQNVALGEGRRLDSRPHRGDYAAFRALAVTHFHESAKPALECREVSARFPAAAETVNRGGMAEMIVAVRATFAEEGLDRLLAERTWLQLRAARERIRAASDGSLESRAGVRNAIRRGQG